MSERIKSQTAVFWSKHSRRGGSKFLPEGRFPAWTPIPAMSSVTSWVAEAQPSSEYKRCHIMLLDYPRLSWVNLTWPSSMGTALNDVRQAHLGLAFFFCKPINFLNLLTMLMKGHKKKMLNTNRCLLEKGPWSGTAAFTNYNYSAEYNIS